MAISHSPAGARRILAPASVALGTSAALAVAVLTARWGHDGYDLDYALIWGRELAHGRLPTLAGSYAPTPHPAANAVAAVLSPLGRTAAAEAFLALVGLSLAWIATATWWIGRSIFGPAAGALAAVVVISRPSVIGSALRGSIDLPALALVLTALALLLDERPRRRAALGLLAIAGLLRPETWLLSLALLAWRWRDAGRPDTATIALAVLAPITWALADLALTGDPLFSLHSTRVLADELERPRSATLAPLLIPSLLSAITGAWVLVAATVGLIAASTRRPAHYPAVFGVLAIALAAFVVLGFAGLPLLARYLFPPAALLIVLASGAVLPGHEKSDGQRPRGGWSAVIAGMALVAAIPTTVSGVQRAVADSRERHTIAGHLRAFAGDPVFQADVRACGPPTVGTYRLAPALAAAAGVTPDRIAIGTGGALVLPRSGRAVESLSSASDAEPLIVRPPVGSTVDARVHNPDWAVATACSASP